MSKIKTLVDLLARHPDSACAISAPGCKDLTYGNLRLLIADTVRAFRSLHINRSDRVAIVLANGPEMAAAFISVACGATAAPLNPAYRADEFEFYLSDLNAKALIVAGGANSPAIEIAEKLMIPIITLIAMPEKGAGYFVLDAGARFGDEEMAPDYALEDDVALVLHTSGTTSRPKIVPLSQANICASAQHIAQTLQLTDADRGLVIMPLFHIHGLIAAVLAPLSAGGSIFCTPGFNALKFFAWMLDSKPSWYTAVPTMHQTILARAAHNKSIIADHPLRFIRSSSSSLPPQVLAELENTFHAPVIESYGMTEAAHQMASNPLPPAVHKPGSVGIAAGPEIVILDEAGTILPIGATGEIAIRGPNVTLGYENNPKANSEAFTNGWFRTGDQGMLDADHYLWLTGRLKEIINRGGEKISPREVDEVLMDHPAISQVVTFAIPHDKLGEEVGAVVVLREGLVATERELRDYVATRLVDFKVPRKILFMEEIPKGATGKLQRIGLAEKLGLT
jgi:acyl-CoA synthetase (AMP-forming)/AMP-acid ligase II